MRGELICETAIILLFVPFFLSTYFSWKFISVSKDISQTLWDSNGHDQTRWDNWEPDFQQALRGSEQETSN